MNAELALLYEADQQERADGAPDPASDQVRLLRTRELLATGLVSDPQDQFRAAMLLHHGDSEGDFELAHQLALRSFSGGYERARKLVALTLDRWLSHMGKPQRYGTQYVHDGTCWRLLPCDPATTDDERAEWEVPPLQELLEMVDLLNRG